MSVGMVSSTCMSYVAYLIDAFAFHCDCTLTVIRVLLKRYHYNTVRQRYCKVSALR